MKHFMRRQTTAETIKPATQSLNKENESEMFSSPSQNTAVVHLSKVYEGCNYIGFTDFFFSIILDIPYYVTIFIDTVI